MRKPFLITGLIALTYGCASVNQTPPPSPQDTVLNTGAPVDTDTAGKLAEAARHGLARVICLPTSFGGSGFLHVSGNLITAAHVVAGCAPSDLLILTAAAQRVHVASVAVDEARDLALLRPTEAIRGTPLAVASASTPHLGTQVSTWGYPGGYDGLAPLLSVGYFSGVQEFSSPHGAVQRWVINAAFNGGNSGGPVFTVEDGRVIGVVSSKLAPLPKSISSTLDALQRAQHGLQFTGTTEDGKPFTRSEAQLVADVLQYLRSQVQLVIGYAVTTNDLNTFLKGQRLAP